MNIQQAIEGTKKLNPNEKALLAHCLISSLENNLDEDVDTTWAQLSETRYSELLSGKVTAVSWDSIKQNIKD